MRCEEHQHRQVLGDIHEPMLDGSLHEDEGTGDDYLLLPTGPKRRFPADDEIHLILGMGLLLVGLTGFKTIQAHAQSWDAQEFLPAVIAPFAFRRQAAQIGRLHWTLTTVRLVRVLLASRRTCTPPPTASGPCG